MNKYALISAFAITGVITLVWASTLPARFTDTNTVAEDASPRDAFADIIDSVENQLGSVTDAIEPEDASRLGNLTMDDSISQGSTTATSTEAMATSAPETSTSTEEQMIEEETHFEQQEETSSETNEEQSETNSETHIEERSEEPRVILIGTTTSQKSE